MIRPKCYGLEQKSPSLTKDCVLFPWKSRCCDKYLGGRSKFTLFLKQYNDTNTYMYVQLPDVVINNINILYFQIGLYGFLKNLGFQTCVRCLPTVVSLFTNWPYIEFRVPTNCQYEKQASPSYKSYFICCIRQKKTVLFSTMLALF